MKDLIILAGGLATRLRPLTDKIPKSMVLVNGLPFIDYQLKLFKKNNFKKIIICLGYKGDMIKQYVVMVQNMILILNIHLME